MARIGHFFFFGSKFFWKVDYGCSSHFVFFIVFSKGERKKIKIKEKGNSDFNCLNLSVFSYKQLFYFIL